MTAPPADPQHTPIIRAILAAAQAENMPLSQVAHELAIAVGAVVQATLPTDRRATALAMLADVARRAARPDEPAQPPNPEGPPPLEGSEPGRHSLLIDLGITHSADPELYGAARRALDYIRQQLAQKLLGWAGDAMAGELANEDKLDALPDLVGLDAEVTLQFVPMPADAAAAAIALCQAVTAPEPGPEPGHTTH